MAKHAELWLVVQVEYVGNCKNSILRNAIDFQQLYFEFVQEVK